ncbi:MAG: hypothetical protein U1A27_12590 [Phycisphaerae bacterium]
MSAHAAGVGRARVGLWLVGAFVATCLASRAVVYLLMSNEQGDLYLRVGGTHVHHHVWGICLLAALGVYQLVHGAARVDSARLAAAYGVALGLTFDEFGFWLNLGGSYWQRASYDAMVAVGLALAAVVVWRPAGRALARRSRRAIVALAVCGAVAGAGVLLPAYRWGGRVLAAVRDRIEPPVAVQDDELVPRGGRFE